MTDQEINAQIAIKCDYARKLRKELDQVEQEIARLREMQFVRNTDLSMEQSLFCVDPSSRNTPRFKHGSYE